MEENATKPLADTDNEALNLAGRLIEETGANLFLTGKAGTGKTTFLRRLQQTSRKRIVVLAPTGIAAINAGGMTIHSFFQLNFGPFIPGVGIAGGRRYDNFSKEKRRVIRTMDLLVIDEISMVRSDLLDAVDFSLRRHRDPSRPFGGVQLLLIGDLAQLPPVVKEDEWALLSEHYATPYFFSSHALEQTGLETIELTRVYRQEEGEFLEMLNRVRDNKVEAATLEKLNSRYIPDFRPAPGERWIRLVTHNYQARNINERELQKISEPTVSFHAEIKGEFPESSYPADAVLELKKGAQVMFIKNDPSGMGEYYNGLLGEISSLSPGIVEVITEDGRHVKVGAAEWDNNKYVIDEENGELKEDTVGTFSQIPLRKAWAITIHKSQGLTFDRAVIDAASSFAHGQTYVALSRCRTFEGLVLERPLNMSALISDRVVEEYMHQCSDNAPDEKRVATLRDAYNGSLLTDLFEFTQILYAIESLSRSLDENLIRQYPNLCDQWREYLSSFKEDVCKVAMRFHKQYESLLAEGNSDLSYPKLDTRIRKGAEYFGGFILKMISLINKVPVKDIDNKAVKKKLKGQVDTLREQGLLKSALLQHVASKGVRPGPFMKFRTETLLQIEGEKPKRKRGMSAKSDLHTMSHSASISEAGADNASGEDFKSKDSPKAESNGAEDIRDPRLYQMLKEWRLRKSQEQKSPAYVIMNNATMINMVNANPHTLTELLQVKGVGQKFVAAYGEEVLEIIEGNTGENQQ
ncbi:MAG: AAA family ATPase [Muribaculum sp.]|nr:AAA family ATPase [Muribaculum sp.]